MQKTTFYRPAREYPPILPTEEIVINAPPLLQPAQSGAMGWLQYALPAVGGLGSLVFVFAYHSNPLLIVAAGAMALCSLGSGLLMGIFQRRSNRRQLQQQRSSYLDYLTHLRKYLLLIAQKQRQVDERLFPSYEDLTRRALEGDYLWERRPTDADFLAVRVGQGPVPLCSPLRLDLGSSALMTQHQPELRVQAEALVSHYSYLDKLSAVIPLRRFGVISLCGEAERTRALARAILCQLAVHQSPQDIRCLLSFSAEARKEWEWAKWLPHTRCLRRLKGMGNEISSPLCMLADTREHLRALLQQQILPELERRRRLSEGEDGKKKEMLPVAACLPHLFIILDDFLPRSEISQLPELETLFNDCALFGVTILCLVKDLSQEPAQIAARLRISPIGGLTFEEKKYGGEQLEGLRPDGVSSQFGERIARGLAPLTLVEAGSTQDLAQDIRLLDLLAVPSLDTFNPQESAWQARPRADFLRVPLGMQADGRLLTLDLKEAADEGMGPHGLIVGATGSGKSELLRTLVVALAATHDPHLLNFVLIDFKGGASFADFAALPHVAGIVTNLQSDLSLVDRVYSSLLGEQQRRQRLLHEAGNLDNIKQYQLMWQMNPGMEPMPHLLLIADEFAELIASRSDFLDLFVTMGRVGRSLGLHLLFATQRLEEGRIRGLESHLRYRICLRTFSASESRTVLGTTDAYFLPSVPGMGYFKVDADTPELFKTALVSVPYVPAEVQRSLSSMVRLFTPTGQLQRLPAPSMLPLCRLRRSPLRKWRPASYAQRWM
ncbi:MAG TPA: type VII secretion protein EccCa [Ktedonobacteraceae bacterium]|nr:type VII secretion protein EccCa [Ktedonobacteraceae bacterium]